MPQYYYTGVSDQTLQYNKIKYKKKRKKRTVNATQSTGRAMNNKGPYDKDIRVFMRVCRRMSLDTSAWYFYTMSPYL